MKELTLESKEFKRVLHNLHLENMSLHSSLQKKVVDLVNSGVPITSNVIKETLKREKL
ncbi:Zn-dependent hydrolase [Sporosarcina sp. 179-K 3D1 HS]|uniref:Zn-dependent hydrolase n=1 Tax=Sporosarcina sp. 179-K 3D1 HS TaxID=3232169 RepID=UPI0039A388BF